MEAISPYSEAGISMRGKVVILIFVVCFVLISMEIAAGNSVDSIPGGQENPGVLRNDSSPIGNGFIKGEGAAQMNSLISLLQDMGLDISYGNDGGTVFSMVDQSLTRIITDLSSGNTHGFIDIPLIRETMNYLGMSPEDVIVNPENVSSSMKAIDRYNQEYSVNLSSPS